MILFQWVIIWHISCYYIDMTLQNTVIIRTGFPINNNRGMPKPHFEKKEAAEYPLGCSL
jgi:hypothetical protein